MGSNNRCIIDSSVFVALYRPSDALHEEAKAVFTDIEECTLYVHPYVVQEVATVLCYTDGLIRAQLFLAALQESTNVILVGAQLSHEIPGFLALNKRISFTDATVLQLAVQLSGRLISFDKQMLRIAKRLEQIEG